MEYLYTIVNLFASEFKHEPFNVPKKDGSFSRICDDYKPTQNDNNNGLSHRQSTYNESMYDYNEMEGYQYSNRRLIPFKIK